MEDLKPVSVVHYYDVRLRETLCGLRGFEHRSTKHPRGVTCPACAGLLRDRKSPAGPGPSPGTPGRPEHAREPQP